MCSDQPPSSSKLGITTPFLFSHLSKFLEKRQVEFGHWLANGLDGNKTYKTWEGSWGSGETAKGSLEVRRKG